MSMSEQLDIEVKFGKALCWGCRNHSNCYLEFANQKRFLVECTYYEFPQRVRMQHCKGFERLMIDVDEIGVCDEYE